MKTLEKVKQFVTTVKNMDRDQEQIFIDNILLGISGIIFSAFMLVIIISFAVSVVRGIM